MKQITRHRVSLSSWWWSHLSAQAACDQAQAQNGVTRPDPAQTPSPPPTHELVAAGRKISDQTISLDMPPLKQPKPLLVACQNALEKEVLSRQCCSKRLQEIGEILPYSVAEDFLHKMLTNIPDQDLAPLFTPKIKALQLMRSKKTDELDGMIERLVKNVEKIVSECGFENSFRYRSYIT